MGQLLSFGNNHTSQGAVPVINQTYASTIAPETTFPSILDTAITQHEHNFNQTTMPTIVNDLFGQSQPNNSAGPLLSSNGTTSGYNFSVNAIIQSVFGQQLDQEIIYHWIGLMSSIAMIIGCVLPYVPQYCTIYKTGSARGFSTFVCLTLLIANISRVIFWFGNRFEYPLLIQAALQIVVQIFLLELCVRVQRGSNKRTNLFDVRCFWNWTSLITYLEFLIIFTTILGLAMYFLIECKLFVEAVGFCALFVESMLGMPQVIKNYQNKSVVGMSLGMVFMWLVGDTFKTGYYFIKENPFQFKMCGIIQITIDILILFQACTYWRRAPVKVDAGGDQPKEMLTL